MSSRRRRQLLPLNDISLLMNKLDINEGNGDDKKEIKKPDNVFSNLPLEDECSSGSDEDCHPRAPIESTKNQDNNTKRTEGGNRQHSKTKPSSQRAKLSNSGRRNGFKNAEIDHQNIQETQKGRNKEGNIRKPGILISTFEVDPFLSTDPRKFNYNDEFTRRFKDKQTSVRSDSGIRKNLSRHRYIVNSEPTWPPIKKKILTSQVLKVDQDGTSVIHLMYSPEYYSDQLSFLHFTERNDFNSNMLILHHSPYHMCSLLQISDILRAENKIDMADELLKRAIYAAQCALPPSLNLFTGKIMMPYELYENRAFHTALMKMIDLTVTKGCWNAALEFSKFLLSLDPNVDPLAVLTVIDYYAIRSKQIQWYLDLVYSEDYFPRMDQLPGSMYSIALAHYELYIDAEKNSKQNNSAHPDSCVLKKSDALLREAIKKYPSAVYELQRYCKWNNTKFSSPKFNRSDVGHHPKLFIALFAKHSHSLWKIPEVYSWLNRNIDAVFESIPLPNKNFVGDDSDESITDALIPLYRRILLSTEDPYLRGLIPKKYTSDGINLLDPIPPISTSDSFFKAQ